MRQRVVDRLIVANLEMQAGLLLERSPIAAVESVGADQVEGPGNMVSGALGHDEQHPLAHPLTEQRKEAAVEVGAAPLSRPRIHIEGEEIVPMRLGNVAAAQPFDGDAALQRVAAFLAERLALSGGKRGEKA